MIDVKELAENNNAETSDIGLNLWGEDNEKQKWFDLLFTDVEKALESAITKNNIKLTLQNEYVDTEGLIGLTSETTFDAFGKYCIDNYNFPKDAYMNLSICDIVFEATADKILEDYDFNITNLRSDENRCADDEKIIEVSERNTEFKYSFHDREDFIEELIGWTAEAKGNNKQLMKDDLKYLMSLDDEYIFSSGMTNDYVAFSDSPRKFNHLTARLFAEDISILPVLEEDMMFFALQASDTKNEKLSYCAAGKIENEKFSGIIFGYEGAGEYSDWYVKDHKFLPTVFSDGELLGNDIGEKLLNISMNDDNFTVNCYKIFDKVAPFNQEKNHHELNPELVLEIKDGELKINAGDFHPINYGNIEFGGGTARWFKSLKEFSDKYLNFEELIKKEFESVLISDEDGKIDAQETIKIAVCNLERNAAFAETINIKTIHNYISKIVKEIEDRAGDGESNICNINIEECEICVDCGTVMLPDDECYSRHDGKAMCSECSYMCDDCKKYHSREEMLLGQHGDICKECAQTIKYPKKLVVHVIDDGADIVIKTLEKAGYEVKLDGNVLAYSTDTSIVCKSVEKINSAILLLDKLTVNEFNELYLANGEIHDTEKMMNKITATVMKTLDVEAEAYFHTLSDYVQSELVDNITKENSAVQQVAQAQQLNSSTLFNMEDFLINMCQAITRSQKWDFLYSTEYENDSIELDEAMSRMTDAEVNERFPKICAEYLSKKLNLL